MDFSMDSIINQELDKYSHDNYPFLVYLEPGKKKKKVHTYLWETENFKNMLNSLLEGK